MLVPWPSLRLALRTGTEAFSEARLRFIVGGGGQAMEFRILGPLEVVDAGRALPWAA